MYVELRGGTCMALVFQLAFTGKIARRCQVLTKAQLFQMRWSLRPLLIIIVLFLWR